MAVSIPVTVRLVAASSQTVTVHYATADGPEAGSTVAAAVAGTHYTAASGTLTFAPGQTSKTITVAVAGLTAGAVDRAFRMVLSAPTNAELADPVATLTIRVPGGGTDPDPEPGELEMKPFITSGEGTWYDRFDWIYRTVKDTGYGFFGPPAGPKAFQYPYHAAQKLIAEAPDGGRQSVSETASFWVRLEAWKLGLTGETAGYAAAWNSIVTNFVPSATNQPLATYDPDDPADYTPEGDEPSAYPRLPDPDAPVGADPLYAALKAQYGGETMFLMHWLVDVDGDYGFRNGDGSTTGVFVNNYSRGMHEGLPATIMHPCWDDWSNGGGAYGFLPLYSQGKPTYPAAPFDYGKQFSYTCAPDAEVRAVASGFWAHKFSAEHGASVTSQDVYAKKMGDFLRYSKYDKYFRATPDDGSGHHRLISWYVAWGGEIPTAPATSSWAFRIGSSEVHHGYNGVDVAYMMATDGEGYSPATAGAAADWQVSLSRQLELLRWLQSPEGPIAGGVSNSWLGRYETPTDGRSAARFYGLYYTYAPVWHDPPSNNWVGFQAWGLERVASVYLLTAAKTDTFSVDVRARCKLLLERFIPWMLDNTTLGGDGIDFSIPTNLSWTSPTPIVGQTTTTPNAEGVYEFLPSLDWDSEGDYGAFWNPSTASINPNLHCSITASGRDLGTAASLAQLLIQYAHAKRSTTGGALTDVVGSSSYTAQDCLDLAVALLDRIWTGRRVPRGFVVEEERADYSLYGGTVYVPAGFSGTMPNGDPIAPGSTFIGMRSFMEDWDGWDQVQAYLDGGPAPIFEYNRFWHMAEVAVGFAMLHRYFSDAPYTP